MNRTLVSIATSCTLVSVLAVGVGPARANPLHTAPPLRPSYVKGESPQAANSETRTYVRAVRRQAAAASASTISYAQVEGWWVAAGGSTSTASTAAAISEAESAHVPGIIQQGQPYSTTGWGLWQLTAGNSVPNFGVDFQLLDPWNNAEAAVSKWKDAGGFGPWTTYNNGAYRQFLQSVAPAAPTSDPGQYPPDGSAPSGSTGQSRPGATYGPVLVVASDDIPAVGHFQDSPYTNLAVYRPSNHTFYIRAADGSLLTSVNFGATGDLPAVGHFQDSPYTNLALYRPSNHTFYIRAADGSLLTSVNFGATGDLPAVGHFQDSPYTNLALYRPSNATFYIRAADGSLLTSVNFGATGVRPAVGSYR